MNRDKLSMALTHAIRNAQDAASILQRMSSRRSVVRMVFERNGALSAVQFYVGG